MRSNRLFKQPNVGNLDAQTEMVNFIRQDPTFSTDLSKRASVVPGCLGPRTVITPDEAYSYKFNVVKNVCHNDWNPSEHKHGYYEVIQRSLHVGADGSITIHSGDEVVDENIDEYLFNSGVRKLYATILATGFYKPSAKSFSNDSVLVLEHTLQTRKSSAGSENEMYYIQLSRNGAFSYVTHTRTGNSSYGNFLPNFKDIQEREITDFHQRVIEPTLAEIGNLVRFRM